MILHWTGLVVKSQFNNDLLYIRRFDVRKNDDSVHVITPIYKYRNPKDVLKMKPPLNSTYMCHVMCGLREGAVFDARVRVDHQYNPASHPIMFKGIRGGLSIEIKEAWFSSIRKSGFTEICILAFGEMQSL